MQANAAQKGSDTQFIFPGNPALDELPEDHVVCRSKNGVLTWADLRRRVLLWANAISQVDQNKVAAYHSDAGEFLAILLAAWRCGKSVLIPPSNMPATVSALLSDAEVFFGEFDPQFLPIQVSPDAALPLDDDENPLGCSGHLAGWSSSQLAVQMFTSGTSGRPESCSKTFSQLHAEIALFESLWGERVAGMQSVATVSHHHMYGLPFHLLWPFLSGRAIYSGELPYLEGLPDAVENAASVLITSPAHLATIPSSIDWQHCNGNIGLVFCAGAPLPPEAAIDCKKKLSSYPIEIYGSTETGAAAWRQQCHDPIWQALPGVLCRVGEHQELCLQSPALPSTEWFTTADKVDLHSEQRFELQGRMDKIVKLAGKRISLTAIERELNAHDWIAQARVLPHPNKSDRLCAVVRMRGKGSSVLIDQGVLKVQRQLRQSLKSTLEPIALPRYWRFVHEMPVNALGKTTASDLLELFDKNVAIDVPEILSSHFDQATQLFNLSLYISPHLSCLEGHFPGIPVVAGVVQLNFAERFGREHFAIDGDFVALEAVKFQRVILPNMAVLLSLRFDPTVGKLYFRYSAEEVIYSQGRIVFEMATRS